MSIKTYFLLPAVAILFMACGGKKKDNTTTPGQKEEDFIPYIALLQEQVTLVDSTPMAIYKYTTGVNGKTDTVMIQRDEFHQLAKQFMEPDIISTALRKKYTASTFGDKTTMLANFSYETKDPSLEVQRVNLRFRPGTNSQLTSLDIVKNISGKTQKLFWKSNRFFHIISDAGNGQYTRIEIVWNAGPDQPEIETSE